MLRFQTCVFSPNFLTFAFVSVNSSFVEIVEPILMSLFVGIVEQLILDICSSSSYL